MAATLDIKCPHCSKGMKVPDTLVGKMIKCKGCETPFAVPGGPAKPATAKPATAKPATAKPAGEAPLAFKPDEAAPKKASKHDDDDDQSSNPYGVITDGDDIPRCPFCANELDPPDTKICMTCGYDLLNRKRRESKKVYEHTNNDFIMHWLPAVICIFVVIGLFTISVIAGLNMTEWMTGGLFDADEKNQITGKATFMLDPLCFKIFIWINSAWLGFALARFAYKRLVMNWRPPEIIKKT